MKRTIALVLLAAALAAAGGCRGKKDAGTPGAGQRGATTAVYKPVATPAPPGPPRTTPTQRRAPLPN